MSQTIVIVGGGVTGLAAAYNLNKRVKAAGHDAQIIVVERDERLGGKTQTDVVDGMVIEQGPDSFLVSKPWFAQLCKELGLSTVGTNPNIKSTYIYARGRLEKLPVGMQIMIPTEIGPFVKTKLISWPGKIRAAMEPFVPLKKTDEDESIGSFVGRRFGREVLENIAGPLMGGIHGGDWDGVSIKMTFPMFPKMEKQGSLLLQGMRNKANKPKGPTGSAFQTVPTGLKSAVDALVAASDGVRFMTGTAVEQLAPAGEKYTLKLSTGETLDADAVVLAVPAFAAAELMKDFRGDVTAELNEIPYNNSCVVAVAYNRADIKHPLDASGFLVPHTENMSVTASTWITQKWPHSTPEGKVLMRCFMGRVEGKDWTKEPDEVVMSEVKKGLKHAMGLDAEPIMYWVYRWPRSMAQYRVGHLERIERVDELMAKQPGLYLAGAAYRGVGLGDCVREGNQAADKVAARLGWAPAAK